MDKKHSCGCGCGSEAASLIRQNLALAETAEYQKGAIVSREILKSKTGSVTVFAFDKGQGLSEHTAPFNALVCVLDGEAEIRLSGELFRVGKGGMLIMPAGEAHALHAAQPFKMMLVMLRS
ncbi:MAG: cupin [Elusimicrobia bacterium GWA2_69_24]|nr:MAG: cupin [Elusimicrobia bacterium GWA2_69_24]HBL16955.1 cupin domain-containing protein [Elusimicrobiota bacterium]